MVREWINGDETAKQMLCKAFEGVTSLRLPQPLDRVPLRIGNILEIVGPSPSAKTEILVQVAVNCILPKVRNGVHYGGLEQSVLFLDLDCRFDVFRLSQSLKLQIIKAKQMDVDVSKHSPNNQCEHEDKDLFAECMKRFLYTRCYNSFEFLAALKSLQDKLAKERKEDRPGVHILMIDSIGAFYWIDRGLSSLPQGGPNRKNLSLQTMSESVVQEIKKLLQLHRMFVLATNAITLGDRYATNQDKRSFSRTTSEVKNGNGCSKNISYREYMPYVWQSFVTHRILVRVSDDDQKLQDQVSYLAEWLLPHQNMSAKFLVTDSGIMTSPK